MSEDEIVEAVLQYPTHYVVLTGGEPTLQLTASLCDKLHAQGRYLMMETNGTRPLPEGCRIDWITCSPKTPSLPLISSLEGRVGEGLELKVVFEDSPLQDIALYEQIPASEYRLQPCDTQDPQRNQEIIDKTISYILQHPKWKLSLQTHKILNVR